MPRALRAAPASTPRVASGMTSSVVTGTGLSARSPEMEPGPPRPPHPSPAATVPRTGWSLRAGATNCLDCSILTKLTGTTRVPPAGPCPSPGCTMLSSPPCTPASSKPSWWPWRQNTSSSMMTPCGLDSGTCRAPLISPGVMRLMWIIQTGRGTSQMGGGLSLAWKCTSKEIMLELGMMLGKKQSI